MKPIHQHFIAAALLLLCAFQVSAQTPIDVTFTPASSTVVVGADVAIQMKVTNFRNIGTIQFPIVFNKDVLQLVSVTGAHPSLQNFNVALNAPDPNLALTPGKLAVSWFYNGSSQPTGATIPANGTFFTLNFKVLTDCSSTINMIGMVQPFIDVTNTTSQTVVVNYQNGAATIIAGSCTTNPPVVEPPIVGFHIIANTIYILSGEVGCMPMTANDFERIESMSYALNWNPLILEQVSTRDGRTTKLIPNDISFGTSNINGRQAMIWYTPTAPNTRPDLSTIYEVCFKAKGNAGTNTLVTPNGLGFPEGSFAEIQQVTNGTSINIWKDTTGIKDTIYIQNNPVSPTAVAYTAEKDSTIQNSVGCVDVRVKNFTNATYGEFAMTYDSLQLTFNHFSLGTNPLGLDTSTTSPTNIENFLKFRKLDIITQDGEEQTLRFIQYAYRKPAGTTLTDNAVIFSACFKAIGPVSANGTSIPVKITSYFDPGNATVPIGAAKRTVGSVPIGYTSGSVFIKSASVLSAVTTVQNVTCAGGTNGSITLAVNNCSGNATYLWAGPGITNNNNTLQNPTNLTAGGYTVTVTCAASGTTTASATVVGSSAIAMPQPTITNTTCNGGSDGAISIAPTGGTGAYSYLWAGPTGFTSTSPNPTGLRAGNNYRVTITDASSCTFASTSYTVTHPNPITLATTSMVTSPVKCKGGSDGSINLPDAAGGTPGYTYAWTGPAFTSTSKNISGLKVGGYTVVVTDSRNCAYTHNPLQITEPSTVLEVSTPAVSNVKCFNSNDGQVQINVIGGTTPHTYSWKNGATLVSVLEDPANLAAGNYAVTVTDANQCTATSTATINGPTAVLNLSETHVDAACANSSTGAIALTITGGWSGAAPTVAWPVPLPPQASVNNILPGTYIATVTDNGGCAATISATVNSAPPITIGAPAINNVACSGQATGGIVIFPAGGGSGTTYSVSWTGGLSGTAISNLAGGSYTPTVTNLNSGCTAVFPAIAISEPSPIAIDSNMTAQNGVDQNGSIDLSASGGTPSYVFSWTGPGGFTSTQDSLSGLAAGNYFLTITDANFCIYTTSANIIGVNQDPLVGSSVTTVKNACSNDGCINLLITATATATPFTIAWGTGAPMMTTDYTPQVCGLSPGIYNITITDSEGHTTVLPAQAVSQLAVAGAGSAIIEPFDEAGNGSIVLTPVPAGAPLTYLWNTGSTASALVNLDSGTYIVTITQSISGCSTVDTIRLNRKYLAPNGAFNVVNPKCDNTPTGSVAFNFSGANGPNYQFSWSGPNGFAANTKNISALAAGTYTVTVTDESESIFTYDTIIIAQSNLEVTNVSETSLYTGGYQVSALNACDGKATVAFSGQSGTTNIVWSNGITTVNNTTLCAGAYSVTVTDQLGCSSVWSDSLSYPQGVSAIVQVIQQISCSKECNGKAQVSVSGGVTPYTVRWALPGNQFQIDQLGSAAFSSTAVNLCGGNYSVTITDGNGASQQMVVNLPEPAAITAIFNQNLPTRFNSCDGETMITAQGASGVVNYTWSGNNSHNGTDARASGLCAGEIVTFSIVDDNGCTAIATDTIGYPEGGCLQGSPVITPGEQDGNNDELYITCAETVDNTVEIFNRWGQMVYNVTNYDNNSVVWTGTTRNGADLPEGVYFYVMNYTDDQGTQQRIKGYVNLLR